MGDDVQLEDREQEWASVVVRLDTERAIQPLRDPLPAGSAYRIAPLLAVLRVDGAAVIVVGRCVVVSGPSGTRVEAHVRGLWTSSSGAPVGPGAPEPSSRHWRGAAELDGLGPPLTAWLSGVRLRRDLPAEGVATHLAKALAEFSRDSVADLRALRYEIEAHLSETIRGVSDSKLDSVLADLVELSIVVGRAQDEARDGVREGMGAWRTAEDMYHAQRHRVDPSLPERPGRASAEELPWFPIHDAGVRQCAAAEEQLGKELDLLQGRLAAASTVATAREAQAQESFTVVATVGGVALGVPGVIVGLYGVSDVLPLGWDGKTAQVLGPLALSCVFAALLSFVITPGPVKRKTRRAAAAIVAVLVLVVLVYFAGWLFPVGGSGSR